MTAGPRSSAPRDSIPPSTSSTATRRTIFWMMGDTGPCGPCSELHVDLTPGPRDLPPERQQAGRALVNRGDARCIEIWNLVFIQFNANPDGSFGPLPARHVDTGMGFERVCSIIQGTDGLKNFEGAKISNYETDVFRPIFDALEKITGKTYKSTLPASATALSEQEKVDVAFRVIADHLRTLSFSIADGIRPSNEGRGYVLRRILRRAVRYGRNLGLREPFLAKLVPILAETMGPIFPELVKQAELVKTTLTQEEESFFRTLERGIELFDSVILSLSKDQVGFPRRRSLQALRHLRLPARPHRAHGPRARPHRRYRRIRPPDGRAARPRQGRAEKGDHHRRNRRRLRSRAHRLLRLLRTPKRVPHRGQPGRPARRRRDAVLRRDGRPGRRHRRDRDRRPARSPSPTRSAPAASISIVSPSRSTLRPAPPWSSASIRPAARGSRRTTPPPISSTGRCAQWSATPSLRRAATSAPTGSGSTSPTGAALTPDQLAEVESLVNGKIDAGVPVKWEERPLRRGQGRQVDPAIFRRQVRRHRARGLDRRFLARALRRHARPRLGPHRPLQDFVRGRHRRRHSPHRGRRRPGAGRPSPRAVPPAGRAARAAPSQKGGARPIPGADRPRGAAASCGASGRRASGCCTRPPPRSPSTRRTRPSAARPVSRNRPPRTPRNLFPPRATSPAFLFSPSPWPISPPPTCRSSPTR